MAVTDPLPPQLQNFAIPVQITDEIANLSTIKRICFRNSGFDVEPYGINVLFKEKTIKQEMSYILFTLLADQTEGNISASESWYSPELPI